MLKARQIIGKYRILGRIATGPLADVYRAQDTIQKVKVALKIPKSSYHMGHEEFLHEVRVVTKLRHPNILAVLNASYIDKLFVIAMELGDESLADRVKRRMSTTSALDLAGQALAAMAHAHENKIIHCDIKPENFILFPDNQLRLADFGFAKLNLRTLKASGSGTVDYMAPEQAMGRPKFQSDVFSLGLVIYRLLSGQLPDWPFDWPPVGFHRLSARVSPELIEVLRNAIQLDPKQRYRDAVQMHDAFIKARSQKRKQKRSKLNKDLPRGTAWRRMQWREFQTHFKQALETNHSCRKCEGPVSESMQCCPWCGCDNPTKASASRMSSCCPRCERGVKNDWDYCAWCYGPGFVEEGSRSYPDKRYSARCQSERCRGPLMPFMRYCPWCHKKVRRVWKIKGSRDSCKSCNWGIARDYWNYCAWCREPVSRE